MEHSVGNRFSEHAPLTRDSIVRAALFIVDEEGLKALTMRRLGRELGVEAMSIYHHVANKDALLDALVVELLEASDRVDESATSPVELLERYCRELRRSLRAHPHLASVTAERLPRSIFEADAVATNAERLVASGFDDEAARWILDAFVGFVLGHTLVEAANGRSADSDEAAFETGLRFLLAGLRDELGV